GSNSKGPGAIATSCWAHSCFSPSRKGMRASPGCGAARQKVPGTERIRKERTMSSKSPRASKRISNGQWARGASGNPAGRPVGSRNQSTVFVEQLLLPHQEALVEKTIELALKGDPFALRLCLERLYPVPKERRIDLPLPEVRNAAEATAALSTILTGVGEGQIPPARGSRPGRDRRNPTTPGGGRQCGTIPKRTRTAG